MVNYQNGKIYKIEDVNGEMCYIGSTTKDMLCKRMAEHRQSYKRWQNGNGIKTYVFEIFEKYGVENCRIVLLEICPCESRDELLQRETHFMKLNKCVNKCIPIINDEERKTYLKGYYINHKEDLLQRNKQYRIDNKDKIEEYTQNNLEKIHARKQKYREDNKIQIHEQQKKYRDDHKAQYTEKMTCECGSTLRRDNKHHHIKTKHHLEYIANQAIDI